MKCSMNKELSDMVIMVVNADKDYTRKVEAALRAQDARTEAYEHLGQTVDALHWVLGLPNGTMSYASAVALCRQLEHLEATS